MTLRNIGLIFRREVADQLRDRRTLFMIAVLPVLLYPAMGIGMVQMTLLFTEQPRTVVILGADQLPSPELLDGDHFAARWFRNAADADRLLVLTDQSSADDEAHPTDAPVPLSKERYLLTARKMRSLVEERMSLPEDTGSDSPPGQRRLAIRTELSQMFAESGFQVLIIVPDEFRQNLDDWRAHWAARQTEPARNFPRPVILQNSADEKSMIAHARVTEVFHAWEKEILREQLKTAGLPESLPNPINAGELDLAVKEQLSANLWSKLFPALLVIMALTGAFYPAIDLCAGEKERGTMETLLICPASRTEIVLGKFLTVLLFSVSTALLNLSSLGFTGKYMASLGAGGAAKFGDVALPPLSSLAMVLVMLIPLSTLFSALCLAFATFARSSKEGQYYLTPLLMVTMGLTIFCLSPAVELQPFYSVMPVIGPALLLKGLLRAQDPSGELMLYAVPVLVTSLGYSLLALWWAIDQFSGEDVLFREAERFDLGLWIRHLLRDKEPVPTFAEAVFCFILIMFLQFAALRAMQSQMIDVKAEDRDVLMLRLLIIQQIAIIATPALFMGVMLVGDLRKTFLIYVPRLGHLLAGILLAVTLHPLSLELGARLQWFFPPLPPDVIKMMTAISSGQIPLWQALLAFAVAPAICEEIAFRGFILSGFRRSGRIALAIVLSSLLFGIMHLIPQQVFNASLLGLVLGYVAVKTDSLLPCLAFHFSYNSLEVLRNRFGEKVYTTGGWQLFFSYNEQTLRYEPLLLLVCGFVALSTLAYLKFGPSRTTPPFDAASALLTHRSMSGA